MEVREQRVDEAVAHLGVAEGVRALLPEVGHQMPPAHVGERLARAHALGHLEDDRHVERAIGECVDHLLVGRVPLEVAARQAVGGDGAGERVEGVVLRDGVAEPGEQLRVGRDDVERLHERLLRELPVAAQDLPDVDLLVAVLERPRGEVLRQRAQMLGQRSGLGIEVDEHEPAPGVDLDRRKGPLLADLREVPAARDVRDGAVEVPGDAVERAGQVVAAAGELLEDTTPVQAHVAVRRDGVGRRAHHEDLDAGDVVGDVVADLGDVLLATGDLPHALPDPLHLELVELLRGVALGGHPELLVAVGRLPAIHLGDGAGVGVEQSLVDGALGRGVLGHAVVEHGHGSGPSQLAALAVSGVSAGKSFGFPGTPAGS